MSVRRSVLVPLTTLALATGFVGALPSALARVPVARAATSFAGEALFGTASTDDWEPAVAADPSAPYVYVLTTRYRGPKACSACPSPALILRVSSDGGQSFGPDAFICICKNVHAQNDPQLAVAADGTVFAAWLNDYNPGVVFSRSTDHGQTWTAPIAVKAKAFNFTDKPWLAISPSGQDVYIAFNKSDSYVVSSHDFGATFSKPVQTNGNDGRYYFAGGGFVAANGAVTFSETSFTQNSTGPVQVVAIRSTNAGQTWAQVAVDTVQEQPTCTSAGCPVDYYGPQAALGADASGKLVVAYAGATSAKAPQRMLVKRSTDAGATWSARTDVSAGGATANAVFPAVIGRGTGEFRMWFMDDENGPAAWNVWYRTSTDGGATWSTPLRASDASGGASYKTAGGFAQPYGDYGEIAITSTGKTFAVWGEGTSYNGPGGTWYNRQI